MKKTVLILTLCIVFMCGYAQQMDATMLYGCWDQYSVRWGGHTYCRDSMAADIDFLMKEKMALYHQGPSVDDTSKTIADSLQILYETEALRKDMFNITRTYDNKGNVTQVFNKDSQSEDDFSPLLTAGHYKWTAGNRITEDYGGNDTNEIVILSLTPNKLTIQTYYQDSDRSAIETYTDLPKIDTTLIYGRWQFYSSTSTDGALCRDSMDRNIKTMMSLMKAMDSLMMIGVIKDLFETYFSFDKNGQVITQSGVNKDPIKGGRLIETGTYQWTGGNKMIMDIRSKLMTFTILQLTETELIIKGEGADLVDKGGSATLTRVK